MGGGGKSIDFSKYMTVSSYEVDGMTVKFTNTLEYCLHSEGIWRTLPANTTSPKIIIGDKMSFRANLEPTSSAGIGTFTLSGGCDLEGNCMSLLYGDNAEGQPMKAYGFYKLFNNCGWITKVSKDFLPATTLANYCYSYMFNGVTQLTQPPDLPATTLAAGCYHTMFSGCVYMYESPLLPAKTLVSQCYAQMFYYCTRLKKITAMFTTTPSASYTSNWVYNVASTGTFVKNKNAAWSLTGSTGIPSGWTVEKV